MIFHIFQFSLDFSHFFWVVLRNLRLSGNLPPFDKIIGREKD
jgi:hypothetical protein